MKSLITELKDNDQDYEFYPTSKEMIKCIYENTKGRDIKVLDIGCGTCNFKKFYEELAEEDYQIRYEEAKQEAKKKDEYFREPTKSTIDQYYVIEKSKILLDRLHKDIIVLGTDFNETMLIDKPVNTIFCNPPYSEFKSWMSRIIREGNCNDIYLIVPKRWKEDEKILNLMKTKGISPIVLGSFDFLDAERQARAKVDILHIIKRERGYSKLGDIEQNAFDEWFDETFPMSSKEDEVLMQHEKEAKEKQKIKDKLICEPKDKAKLLVELYEEELNTLFHNFKAICSLDAEVLETIGVSKKSVKEAVKQKTINLKSLYWKMVFDELDEITSRLTRKSRDSMLSKFTELKSVEFTLSNIYSLVIWVIKNANSYYDSQLIEFYKNLSCVENVKPYKSNMKTFEKEDWKYSRYDFKKTYSHYTLDFRIIARNYDIGVEKAWGEDLRSDYRFKEKIKDIGAIFKNLGFEIIGVDTPQYWGTKYYGYGHNGDVMFEFKCFKNENLHLKFNIEFTKALNVEVSRLLGWIKSKEDIKKEFCNEMAEGAEKYFKVNACIGITSDLPLLGMKYEEDKEE